MPSEEQQHWHYVSAKNERLGPVSIRELSDLAGKGLIQAQTLVWRQGYESWIPAEKISKQLSEAQLATPTSPTHETTPVSLAPAETREPATEPAKSEEVPSNGPAQEHKPRKGSFVFPRLVFTLVTTILLSIVALVTLLAMDQSPWLALSITVTGLILGVMASLAAFKKERYEIHDSRLICHRGGLISDQTTELEIRNITHVKIKLPWLRHKLFGVGDVIIESAGNSKPMIMRVIRGPEAVYSDLRERMQKNGYDLTQKQLLHEERPALVGVIAECFGLLVGVFFAAVFTLPAIFMDHRDAVDPGFEMALKGLLAIIAIGVVAFVIVRFLDLRRRTYRIYNDVVVYEEGFLTRNNAFIPYENIADSNTKCSFFDRILGLYDVQISCQGSGSEIKFRRLRHGVALSAAIDQLVVIAGEKPKLKQRSESKTPPRTSPSLARRADPERVPAGEAWVAELGINQARLIVPLLLLVPLVPIWILAMIQAGVRIMSTRYSVRPGSLRHSYRFLTTHDREFAYDKVTGLVIKRNLWDRWFGTMTLRFWSIGSGQPLEFAHIKCNEVDLPALLRQVGIPAASPQPYQAEPSFSLLTWLRAYLKALPLVLIFAAAVIVASLKVDPLFYYLLLAPLLGVMGAFLYAKLYYSKQQLSFHDHHIEAEQGIFAKRHYYARFGNIKKVRATRFPGGEEGALEIFVAGEEEVANLNQQRGKKKTILKPCSFITGMLPEVGTMSLLLGNILCGRVEPTIQETSENPQEVLMEAPRSVGNAITKLLLLSLLLFPLIVLLPITIPLTVIRVRRWRYRIETERIVTIWGIFYRSEMSILLDRVDSLQQNQGPINKMYKNGNVSIMTAGSSRPDLDIIDSPDYLKLYELIRENSQ